MCNCGKKRDNLVQQSPVYNKPVNLTHKSFIQKKEPVLFEYTGRTALTISGGITKKNYRFNFPGDKQYVEANDASAMITVPVLKKIK